MNRIDLHNHTEFSFDSEIPMEHSIITAINKHIDIFGFSDHLDFAADDPGAHYYRPFDQLKNFHFLKSKYSDRIKLHLGIEASYEDYYYGKTVSVINSIPYDYIIMSVHFVDSIVISDYIRHIEENSRTVNDVDYMPYFLQMKQLAENAQFDILGHMDYYKKYSKYAHKDTFKRYADIIREILTIIVKRGSCLEINTSGLRYKCNEQFPSEDFLSLYKELGGKTISVGSDSHKESHIGCCLENAHQLINKYNFQLYKPEEKCQE